MKSSSRVTKWVFREWFAFFILLLGVIATLLFALYANRAAVSQEQLQFDGFVQRTQDALTNGLDTYVVLLRSGSGLLEANEDTTRAEFRTFVNKLELRNKYPAVQGVGYIQYVPAAALPNYLDEMRSFSPDFSLTPEGERNAYFPIVFIEPFDERNQAMVGYDMSSEPVRNEALEKARDSGQPTASGKVQLLQENPETGGTGQAGFLIYSPIYAGADDPVTVEERRQRLIGFVYSPFRVGTFVSSLTSVLPINPALQFAIYDGLTPDPRNLLYTNAPRLGAFDASIFYETATLNVPGRQWTVEFWASPNFGDSVERDLVPIILTGGLTISFLLFVLARSQYQALLESQRKAAELRVSQLELRQSRGQYQLVVENTEDLVNLLDMEGQYVYVSPSHQKILGYTSEELMEKSLLEFVHPEDVKQIEKEFNKITNGKTARAVYRFRHKKGQYLTLEGVGSAIADDSGVPYVFVTTSRDISQRVELEKRKDEFISIASHELKTPVTSIKAYAQYLRTKFQRTGDEQSSTLLEKMDKQLDKLTVLIGDLLDVSKIEAGKLQLNKQYFDLNELTADLVEEMQRTTDTHTLRIEGRVRRKLFGDRERVGQVITNFLSNAIKYSPEGKVVTIKLSATATQAQLAVKDTGIGIPYEKQRKIFTRFFRVDGNKQETFPGLGLGLYISAQIIRRHKGKIWVESEPGNGSTFCFTLPFRKRTVVKESPIFQA